MSFPAIEQHCNNPHQKDWSRDKIKEIFPNCLACQVNLNVPGMDQNDVEISLSDNLLTLRGEKKDEKEDKRRDYYRMERSYGMFERTIPIPEGVDSNRVEASFKKGVLTITLPKSAEFQKERKRIPINVV